MNEEKEWQGSRDVYQVGQTGREERKGTIEGYGGGWNELGRAGWL